MSADDIIYATWICDANLAQVSREVAVWPAEGDVELEFYRINRGGKSGLWHPVYSKGALAEELEAGYFDRGSLGPVSIGMFASNCHLRLKEVFSSVPERVVLTQLELTVLGFHAARDEAEVEAEAKP